jgi:excinuclease ABC subunit B
MRQVDELRRAVAPFRVISDFQPSGDQPAAIEELARRVEAGEQDVVLLGATGTGKTATVAWLAERLQRPILVMQPNKTLAAQYANELRHFFPDNRGRVIRLYYDYYQPEAYVPQTDTLHREGLLDQRRGGAAAPLRHVVVRRARRGRGGTVSCIYGLGSASEYLNRMIQSSRRRDGPRTGC